MSLKVIALGVGKSRLKSIFCKLSEMQAFMTFIGAWKIYTARLARNKGIGIFSGAILAP
jgi:hypothetical protein